MSPVEQWHAFFTIVTKEVRRFMRIWPQTLVPPVITMILYFVIFGELIGSRIGTMGGVDYVQFVAPGLIMMSVITNSYSNVASSFFGNKFSKCIEEVLVSPTPVYVILSGYVIGGVARGLAVGLVVSLASLFFTEIHIHNLLLVVVTVLLTSVMFALAGLVNGVFARNFDDISIIPTFVLTPLTYLGGIFYSIAMLPDVWQGISQVNPVLYMVNAFRYGFLGISDISVSYALAMIVVFILVLGTYAMHLLAKGKNLRA